MLNERPTVAHLVSSYLFATGSWIYTQLVNLKRFRPVVLTGKVENLDQFPFEPVHCYPQPFVGNRLWQIALRRGFEFATRSQERYYLSNIESEHAKLLHAHFATEGYYFLGVKRRSNLPLITTCYGADISRLPIERPKWRQRYQRLFDEGALFLAEGPHMAQAIVDLGCPAGKVRVQHLGVDIERIRFQSRSLRPGEPVRILMACSFREKKGIPYAVEAFCDAAKHVHEMELRIVGGAKTPEEKLLMQRCREIAENGGVADRVHFLGYVPYQQYLDESTSAHLFLAPSVRAANGDTEGGAPVSIIEAAAAGMPVIATLHCDIPNVVTDGQSGLLVPERDAHALAEAIVNLATSPGHWAAFGTAGRARVEEQFDVYKQVAQLEEIYTAASTR